MKYAHGVLLPILLLLFALSAQGQVTGQALRLLDKDHYIYILNPGANSVGSYGGQALALGDAGGFMDVGGAELFSFDGRKPYTIECWIKPSGIAYSTIISKYNGGLVGQYMLNYAQNRVNHHRAGSEDWRDFSIPVDAYTHVAIAYDGDQRIILVNDQQSTSIIDQQDQSFDTSTSVLVGAQQELSQPVNFFSGQVEEVRIWNRALDFAAEEFQANKHRALTGNEEGLIGYWNFDTTNPDGTIPDLSGNGHSGRLQGDAHLVPSEAPLFPPPGSLGRMGQTFTWEAWIQVWDVQRTYQAILEWGDRNGDIGAHFYVKNGTGLYANLVQRVGGENETHPIEVFDVIEPGVWTHVAVTYDGAEAQLYVNGSRKQSMPLSGPLKTSAELYIGRRRLNQDLVFRGLMDGVRLWDRALPERELPDNMNLELSGQEEGLVAYYTFAEEIMVSGVRAIEDLTGHGYAGRLVGSTKLQGEILPLPHEETFDTPGQPHAMMLVPAGPFTMGTDDLGSRDDNGPAHVVSLSDFWIDKYEVPVGHYLACNACGDPAGGDYRGTGDWGGQPVRFVSWEQAAAYCDWAGLRLPTEAEWEKAARGTDQRLYPWGNTQDPRAQYSHHYYYPTGTTHIPSIVGSRPLGASPYGAHDMAANVGEWTADWYDLAYYQQSPEINPQGPASGASKVVRGGNFEGLPDNHTTVRRDHESLNISGPGFGFRCARDE